MISAALSMLETDEQRNILTEFYEENKNRFYAIAYSKLHNRELAEDAVQEAFSRIAAKPDKFFSLSHNKMVSYADVIIRNISIDMFKVAITVEPEEQTDQKCDNMPLLEDIVAGSLQKERLMEFISGLPQLQRDILELRISFDLSNSEIADQLKISENVVRQRLFQARKLISEFLKKENSDETVQPQGHI